MVAANAYDGICEDIRNRVRAGMQNFDVGSCRRRGRNRVERWAEKTGADELLRDRQRLAERRRFAFTDTGRTLHHASDSPANGVVARLQASGKRYGHEETVRISERRPLAWAEADVDADIVPCEDDGRGNGSIEGRIQREEEVGLSGTMLGNCRELPLITERDSAECRR